MRPFDPASLTERQKQCLRLLHATLSIKEIARRLDLSPHTVTEHLRDARNIAGVDRSIDAARLLAAAEAPVDALRADQTKAVPVRRRRRKRKPDQGSAAENPSAAATPAAGVESRIPIADSEEAERPGSARRIHLTGSTRIAMIFAAAFLIWALAGSALASAEAIDRFLLGHRLDLSDPPYRQ